MTAPAWPASGTILEALPLAVAGGEISKDTYVNLMDQYHPAWRVTRERFAEINRGITPTERDEAIRVPLEAGIHRLDRPRRLAPLAA